MATKPNTVASLRAHNATLQRERGRILNAEPNRAEIAGEFEAFSRGAAAAFDQRLAHHVATGNPAEAFALRVMPDGTVNVGPLFAAMLGPEAFTAHLCRHLPEGPGGLSAAERAERLAAIEAEMFEAECAEEQMVESSEGTGAPIARRSLADPRAVLGVHEPRDEAALPTVFDTAPRQRAGVLPNVTHSEYMKRKPA